MKASEHARTSAALIGIAHGSRNPKAAVVTEAIVRRAGATLGVKAHAAYLEDFASPSITDVARILSHSGYRHAIAVPLLFTKAYHATEDAPAAIAAARELHGLEIAIGNVLGTGEDMAETLEDHVSRYSPSPPDQPLLLLGVGSSRPGANAAVEELGRALARRTGREVVVRFATCSPRARDFLASLPDPSSSGGAAGIVVPLFAAPGLLLDKTAAAAARAGWSVLPHLGDSLSSLVADRYRSAPGGTA